MRIGILFSFLIISQTVCAWGVLGHRTVATIAFKYLSPQAKEQMGILLNNQDPADASTWADEIKGSPKWAHTKAYHYAGVENRQSYLDSIHQQASSRQAHGDVVTAILSADAMMRDSKLNNQAKAIALRFMIHLIADLFQPLHTGPASDRGGNEVSVNWFGQETNLHSLWDGALLETIYAKQLGQMSPMVRDKWLADTLLKKYPSNLGQNCEMDLLNWFLESLNARTSAYSVSLRDSQAYAQANGRVVEAQLVQAGLSLACSINSIFTTGARPTPKQLNTVESINQALGGNLFQLVSLLPQ